MVMVYNDIVLANNSRSKTDHPVESNRQNKHHRIKQSRAQTGDQ